MTAETRRQEILAELNAASSPVSATTLAEKYGVTRQVIVADVALLRAAGNDIRAEHKGYLLERAQG